jgi:hypothetical protein
MFNVFLLGVSVDQVFTFCAVHATVQKVSYCRLLGFHALPEQPLRASRSSVYAIVTYAALFCLFCSCANED